MKKALMIASVASMIDKFNMNNIDILKQLGYSVDVAANFDFGSITSSERVNDFKKELLCDNIDVYNIPIPRKITNIKGTINSYRIVKKICKNNKYEIVHCHSPIGGVIARLAARRFRKDKTKVIYTAHGFHFFKGAPLINWLIYFPIEWICSFFTDTLITINEEDYEFAKKHMHAKEIKYVPGIGVDTKKYFECTVDAVKKREDINVPKNSIVLLSIGELNKNKNHKLVIEALSMLKKYDIHYCIAGSGDMKEYLEKIARNNGILENIHFLGYRSDIKDLLSISDLFCFPSFREGLPVSVMEAMASGLPCIVTKIRGNTDLIQHERNGILISPEDVFALANAIERLILDDELRLEMSKHNIKDIEKFDIQNVKSIMSEIYLAYLE